MDSQKLGLIKIRDDNQSEPMFSEHPSSFTNMINSLSALLPDLEGWDKSGHVCSNQEEEDLYDWNIALEYESKAKYLKDLPPAIKTIVEENPKVFKSDLDPSDCIGLDPRV